MYEKSLNWLNNIDFKEAKNYVNKRIKYKDEPYPDSYTEDFNTIRHIESQNKVKRK